MDRTSRTAQVKALAASFTIVDPDAEGGKRPGLPSDHWPSPFATEQDARDANGGALPPDMSVLAKARGIEDKFPNWVFNYFTTYSEGGPDYIHALLNGYRGSATRRARRSNCPTASTTTRSSRATRSACRRH